MKQAKTIDLTTVNMFYPSDLPLDEFTTNYVEDLNTYANYIQSLDSKYQQFLHMLNYKQWIRFFL